MANHEIIIDEDFKYQVASRFNPLDGSTDFYINDHDTLYWDVVIRPNGSCTTQFDQPYEVKSADEARAFLKLLPKLYGIAETLLLESDTSHFPAWKESDFE